MGAGLSLFSRTTNPYSNRTRYTPPSFGGPNYETEKAEILVALYLWQSFSIDPESRRDMLIKALREAEIVPTATTRNLGKIKYREAIPFRCNGCQIVTFRCSATISTRKIVSNINQYLPPSIQVIHAKKLQVEPPKIGRSHRFTYLIPSNLFNGQLSFVKKFVLPCFKNATNLHNYTDNPTEILSISCKEMSTKVVALIVTTTKPAENLVENIASIIIDFCSQVISLDYLKETLTDTNVIIGSVSPEALFLTNISFEDHPSLAFSQAPDAGKVIQMKMKMAEEQLKL